MQDRVEHALDEELVDLRVLAGDLDADPAAGIAREIADHERHPPEDLADRNQAHAHDAFAQLALDSAGMLLHRSPLRRGNVRLDALERVGQPQAANDQVADHPHQVVEPRHVDADIVARRSRPRLWPDDDGIRGQGGCHRRCVLPLHHHRVRGPGGDDRRVRGAGEQEPERHGAALGDDRRRADDVAGLAQSRAHHVNADATRNELGRRREQAFPRLELCGRRRRGRRGTRWRCAFTE